MDDEVGVGKKGGFDLDSTVNHDDSQDVREGAMLSSPCRTHEKCSFAEGCFAGLITVSALRRSPRCHWRCNRTKEILIPRYGATSAPGGFVQVHSTHRLLDQSMNVQCTIGLETGCTWHSAQMHSQCTVRYI